MAVVVSILSLFAVLSGTLASGHHGTQASDESYQQLVPELLSRMTTLERKLDESKATEEILLQEIEKLKSENVAQQNQIRELQVIIETEHTADDADDIQPSSDVNINIEANVQPSGRIRQNSNKTAADVPEQRVKPRRSRRFMVTDPGSSVAFSAYLDHDEDILGAGRDIVFNKVLLNDGSGYNQHTGIFTCPVNGVYLFSFFVGSRDVMQISAYLVVNNNNMMDAVAEGYHSTQDLQGGNVAIMRLKQGDAVQVTIVYGSHVESDHTQRITSFSGALLHY